MVACGSWFHLSDVLIDGFADDVGNRAVLVLGDLFEFSELLRFQPDRRKCFRHDLIVYQRYTMSSVIASPAKINRQLSQAPRHSRARDSSGDFAPPVSFFGGMLAVIGFAVSRTWGPIWVPGSAGRAPTPTPRSVRCGLATRDSQIWLMRIAVQFLFQTIYSAFECAEFCLLGP